MAVGFDELKEAVQLRLGKEPFDLAVGRDGAAFLAELI